MKLWAKIIVGIIGIVLIGYGIWQVIQGMGML